LLDDVNLSEINFRSDPVAETEFLFLNMSDGAEVGSLICTGVLVFSYQARHGFDFPLYIGEVNHAVVPPDKAESLLERLHGVYGEFPDPTVSDGGRLHYIHMEGSNLIKLACTGVKFLPAGKTQG
jgi:hypothetical protein